MEVLGESYSDYLEKFFHQCQAATNTGRRCRNKTRENYCTGLHAADRECGYGLKPGFDHYPGATRKNWTKVFAERHRVPDYNEKEYDEMQEAWSERYEKRMEEYEKRRKAVEKKERKPPGEFCFLPRENSDCVPTFGGVPCQQVPFGEITFGFSNQ